MAKLALLFSLFIQATMAMDYYEQTYVGEKTQPNYFGPAKPNTKYNEYKGKVEILEEMENQRPMTNKMGADLFELEHYLQNDFLTSSQCPNESLNHHIHYMRYLYRLVMLSYAYESFIHYSETLKKMGVEDHSCYVDWKTFLHQCQANSEEMKKFLRRSHAVVENYRFILPQDHSFKKYQQTWNEQLKERGNKNPTLARMRLYCEKNKVACKLNNVENMKKIMHGACTQDWTFFKNVCSENDLLFGMSKTKLPTDLILSSNVANVLNDQGNAKECLDRFSKLNAEKETSYAVWIKMLPTLYYYVKENLPARFLQGRLFLPGALKEFDDKGLKEFLFVEATSTPTPSPTSTPVVVLTKTPTPTPTPKIIVTKTPTPTPTPSPTPILVKKSSFLLACEKLDREKLAHVDLDMDLFKQDLTLTPEIIEKLKTKLTPFQTRQALQDMKEYDKFGTKEVPVKLVFLKYLIETSQHQGLYNMRAVLGNNFYVQNDIDKTSKGNYYPARFIALKNDDSTGNRWVISIISDTKKP